MSVHVHSYAHIEFCVSGCLYLYEYTGDFLWIPMCYSGLGELSVIS
jgi:hypothetical protein